mmetsp:Transcript_3198/g.6163  ORF Transcript_3198/g.6163 Transcript_3198/m.6163 type:complete len:204 (+) Transcript_3198:482-1093(+)
MRSELGQASGFYGSLLNDSVIVLIEALEKLVLLVDSILVLAHLRHVDPILYPKPSRRSKEDLDILVLLLGRFCAVQSPDAVFDDQSHFLSERRLRVRAERHSLVEGACKGYCRLSAASGVTLRKLLRCPQQSPQRPPHTCTGLLDWAGQGPLATKPSPMPLNRPPGGAQEWVVGCQRKQSDRLRSDDALHSSCCNADVHECAA